MSELPNPKDRIGRTKPPLGQVSDFAILEECLALVEGGSKYGDFNYRGTEVSAMTYLHAALRHIAVFKNGVDRDPQTGVHHLGSARACLGILLDALATGMVIDDRPPASPQLVKALEEAQGPIKKLHEMYADRNPKHWTIKDTEVL